MIARWMTAVALGAIATHALAEEAAVQAAPAGAQIVATAEALGMLRGIGRTESLRDLNRIEFTAHGKAVDVLAARKTEYKLIRYTAAMNYALPAMRLDVEREPLRGGALERKIFVANRNEAWSEAGQYGMNIGPALMPASELIKQVWITPHGLLRAAIELNGKGVVAQQTEGATSLLIPLLGSTATVRLDADGRPAQLRIDLTDARNKKQMLEVEYSDYQDFDHYGIFFPSRIVQRVDKQWVLDITVDQFFMNPYVVFPPPSVLRSRPLPANK